ncbi:flagellar hook-associated protein FlgK [Tepidiforma sp.]|uniref:flagellar hook-associated protein FlgK n=1 Tax=Tepidiforma sp. TaxID=2682230 RepID=UPI002ADD9057|nr:flagellar hook-associated protein FlgK [Tepidiforma sp.]
MALSVGLDTAVKALRAHQLAVDVAAHNIANAQSPGYSRQRVLLRPIGLEGAAWSSRDSLLGKPGFGVDARDVNRIRDIFLDYQTRQATSSRGQHSAFATPLRNAEAVLNDPSDEGLASLLAKFWGAWHDVANEPESSAARTALVHAAQTLTVRLQAAYSEIDLQRRNLNQQVAALGEEINTYAREIANLNLQIKQVELNGDRANDLRDRRDLLLDQLAQVASIQYSEAATGEVSIYLGSHELVFGTTARTIVTTQDPSDPTMVKLTWQIDGFDVIANSGKLQGVLAARDQALPDLLRKLDTLAGGLISGVNTLHQSGFGLDGTTTGLPFFTGTDASSIAVNPTLIADPRKVAAASAPGAPGDGSRALAIARLQQQPSMVTGLPNTDLVVGETIRTGVTLAGLQVAPSLPPGQYTIVENPPASGTLELRDANNTVVGTATTAPLSAPGGTIQFTSGTNILATLTVTIATPPGTWTPADQVTDLTAATNDTFQIVHASPTDYYSNIVSVLGADVNRAIGMEQSASLLRDHLDTARQSAQGVNIDEEVTNLNAAQHAYNAAARVITVIDDMLDTLINRTGVTR